MELQGRAGLVPTEASLLGVLTAVSSPCPHRAVPVCVWVLTSSKEHILGVRTRPSDCIYLQLLFKVASISLYSF